MRWLRASRLRSSNALPNFMIIWKSSQLPTMHLIAEVTAENEEALRYNRTVLRVADALGKPCCATGNILSTRKMKPIAVL